ncbi:hypothetical protein NI17_014480 [Thermobifida halotolerans]|uniref:Uncharacterized protein n=1 Tax=Thermobifida halotolerans TaxID=483545 RepID=A0A399G4P3_9ACTN|nr:hypothetical protein [Thermobifida halotolerans]UOE18055.1 hypothetical protein NI17_014480 [Thermobifida halotolerans]
MGVRELVWAARTVPLVLRVQGFLSWVGARRQVSREPASGSVVRCYDYLSLDSWAEPRADSPRPRSECPEESELLDFLLLARMLEVVVERCDRVPGAVGREHGWVLPGPEYPSLPAEAARVWRAGVELLAVLWAHRVPGEQAGDPVPARWLELLCAADGGTVAVRVLEGLDGGLGDFGCSLATRLLESLGLVCFRYDLDLGECCVLTPLGRHAAALLRRGGVLPVPEAVR